MSAPDHASQARDNFTQPVKDRLAAEVGHRCSLPGCRSPTIGPSLTEPKGTSNSGVAAHITAAAKGGPRYDEDLTPAQRAGHENGIWCCADHGRIIDNDREAYTTPQLRAWKAQAIELQRRAHSTGEFDPNGRFRILQATEDGIARQAMRASMRCRAAIMTGVKLSDRASSILRVSAVVRTTLHNEMRRWSLEFTEAKQESEGVLMDMRVQWRVDNGVPLGIQALISLTGYLHEWGLKFYEAVMGILGVPHPFRPNYGPCDWNAVFQGDIEQRTALQRAIDEEAQRLEQWARDFIVS